MNPSTQSARCGRRTRLPHEGAADHVVKAAHRVLPAASISAKNGGPPAGGHRRQRKNNDHRSWNGSLTGSRCSSSSVSGPRATSPSSSCARDRRRPSGTHEGEASARR
jgi:hypothetical protein